MFRLKVGAIIVGAVLAFFGVQEFRVSGGATVEPVEVSLAELEAGEQVENSHWLIGEHVAVYGGSVYECRQSKYSTGEPDGDTKCTRCYYPIMSREHPYLLGLASLEEKYGSLAEAPNNEFPKLSDFRVIVKSKKFDKLGDIPDGFADEASVQGLVINRIASLGKDEVRLFRESFPDLDVNDIFLLEADRKPSSTGKSVALVAGGGLIGLLGVAWLIRGN